MREERWGNFWTLTLLSSCANLLSPSSSVLSSAQRRRACHLALLKDSQVSLDGDLCHSKVPTRHHSHLHPPVQGTHKDPELGSSHLPWVLLAHFSRDHHPAVLPTPLRTYTASRLFFLLQHFRPHILLTYLAYPTGKRLNFFVALKIPCPPVYHPPALVS